MEFWRGTGLTYPLEPRFSRKWPSGTGTWGHELAKGSCREVRAQLYVALDPQLYVALDQGYLTEQDFEGLVGQAERTSQLIAGLIRYLQRKTPNVKRPT